MGAGRAPEAVLESPWGVLGWIRRWLGQLGGSRCRAVGTQDLRQDRILAKARRRFVFELNRIIDDDFRGRYLERELVARSPEAIQP